MKVIETSILDVKLIEPTIFEDKRGFFFESFNKKTFDASFGFKANFVQDNHSKSVQGVLRGLHYQLPPYAQDKLVRVVNGEVFDVAVDIRTSSPTYGKWIGEILSSENKKQLWIPKGCAHGFLTLSQTAEFLYKTTDYYNPLYERSIKWNDPQIKIDWPKNIEIKVSSKDANANFLSESDVFI